MSVSRLLFRSTAHPPGTHVLSFHPLLSRSSIFRLCSLQLASSTLDLTARRPGKQLCFERFLAFGPSQGTRARWNLRDFGRRTATAPITGPLFFDSRFERGAIKDDFTALSRVVFLLLTLPPPSSHTLSLATMSDVYNWKDGHLSVFAAAQALFPRGRRSQKFEFSPHSGSERCKAFIGAAAEPSYSHPEWFAWSRDAQLKRGRETRNRIYELLREEGDLLEPDNHEPVGEWLVEAMEKAERNGRPVYVKPGLTASPNFAHVYRQYGFVGAVRWANFRPALLKVTYRPRNTRKPWSLQVIDIKSNHPRAVVAAKVRSFRSSRGEHSLEPFLQVHPQDQFRLLTYRLFLAQLVETIKRDDYARQDVLLLHRLAISHDCALWRYTGCYSKTCPDDACILNTKVGADELAYYLAIPVAHNKKWIDDLLFREVPTRVGIPCEDD